MKITYKGDYALKTVLELALNYDESLMTSHDLAKRIDAPIKFLEQVLSELKLMPDLVVDSGLISTDSLPSTVVKVNGSKLEILREGPISLIEIQKAVRGI